jgi:hypothetical protein
MRGASMRDTGTEGTTAAIMHGLTGDMLHITFSCHTPAPIALVSAVALALLAGSGNPADAPAGP